MCPPTPVIVLGDLDKGVELRVIQGVLVQGVREVPGVPHLRRLDLHTGFRSLFADVLRPVGSPGGAAVGLVVHAVEDVIVAQADREHPVHQRPLVGEHELVVLLFWDAEEEWVLVPARVCGKVFRQAGLFGRVVDVVPLD